MSDKYQKEIEEILRNSAETALDESGRRHEKPLEDLPKSQQRQLEQTPASDYTPSGRWPTIKPGKVLLAGLAIFIIAALLKAWVFAWFGLALLLVGYLLFFVSPRSVSIEERWRGQPLKPGADSSWERFKRWMRS